MKLLTREEVEKWPDGLVDHMREIFPNGVNVITHIRGLVLELIKANKSLETQLDEMREAHDESERQRVQTYEALNASDKELDGCRKLLAEVARTPNSDLERWALKAYEEQLNKNLRGAILVALLTSVVKSRVPYDDAGIKGMVKTIEAQLGERVDLGELDEVLVKAAGEPGPVCRCGHGLVRHRHDMVTGPFCDKCDCRGFQILATE